jgi:hypothetical protein
MVRARYRRFRAGQALVGRHQRRLPRLAWASTTYSPSRARILPIAQSACRRCRVVGVTSSWSNDAASARDAASLVVAQVSCPNKSSDR